MALEHSGPKTPLFVDAPGTCLGQVSTPEAMVSLEQGAAAFPGLTASEDERFQARPPRVALWVTAVVFAPLASHRLFEALSLVGPAPPWNQVALHVLPPLGMLAVSLLIWRHVRPLPGQQQRQSRAGHRGLCIAAGLLLGAMAAIANLLCMLAAEGGEAAIAALKVDPGAAALVLHVILLAPVAEEVAFRGLLYRHLRGLLTPGLATIGSATIFALMHTNLGQAIWALCLGLVSAVAYEQTASILTPILIHALFNAVPVGVAVVRANPHDVGPVWLLLSLFAVVFTLAARSAARPVAADH